MLVIKGRLAFGVGLALLALGLIANEWTAGALLSSDGNLSRGTRLLIRLFNLVLVIAGAFIAWRRTLDLRVPLTIALSALAAFPIVELLLLAMLGINPTRLPQSIVNVLRPIVWNNTLDVQYSEGCMQYDQGLTYRLKPGTCTFSGAEFKTLLRINSAGVRDDEASLSGPEIIFLGDSHTMGWGVQQDEAFPQSVGRRLGRRVLNAGISSYGTARQMNLLKRFDSSRLKLIVIQYEQNDYPENVAYLRGGGKLPVMRADEYQRLVDEAVGRKSYYFGKYAVSTLLRAVPQLEYFTNRRRGQSQAARADETKAEPEPTSSDHARAMLQTLLAGGIDLKSTAVMVLEIKSTRTDGQFISALSSAAVAQGIPNLHLVDVSKVLTAADHLVLDGHMNANGHSKVAELVVETVIARGLIGPATK